MVYARVCICIPVCELASVCVCVHVRACVCVCVCECVYQRMCWSLPPWPFTSFSERVSADSGAPPWLDWLDPPFSHLNLGPQAREHALHRAFTQSSSTSED